MSDRHGKMKCQVDHAGAVGKCSNEKSSKDFVKCVNKADKTRDKCEKSRKSGKDSTKKK